MKVTRRQAAGVFAGALSALAQAPNAEKPADTPADDLAAQRAQVRKNSEALAKVPIEITLEPTFVFKP